MPLRNLLQPFKGCSRIALWIRRRRRRSHRIARRRAAEE
jgi:hypothetical protein